MAKTLKVIVIVLLLIGFLFLVPFAHFNDGYAEIIEIPLDAETKIRKNPEVIPAPQEDCFLSETEYEDPSIHVTITSGFEHDSKYHIAHIQIANASQIRSVMSGSYSNSSETNPVRLCNTVHPVFAINGDFFTQKYGHHVIVRQGRRWYWPKSDNNLAYDRNMQYDVLLIDDQGDFHILKQARLADLEAFQGTIVNSFTFGPGLVIDGEPQSNFYNTNNSPSKKTQRMAVAQVGPLEYLAICCEGPEDEGSKGMTLDEFADLVWKQEGIINAYNLDGGASTMMYFNGKKFNCAPNKGARYIVDILYFASAYVPDGAPQE